MTDLVFYLLVFLAVGSIFLFFHLLMGKAIRPARFEGDKLSIYECGEPAVGSAWIQFDLRYYVVALLFVVFDVEVAFFFPWAVVFGDLNNLAKETYPPGVTREVIVARLTPTNIPGPPTYRTETLTPEVAQSWAWISFADILVFFGVLMVGFAYLWRRGDIDWVRSLSPPDTVIAELPVQPGPEPVSLGPPTNGQAAGREVVGTH